MFIPMNTFRTCVTLVRGVAWRGVAAQAPHCTCPTLATRGLCFSAGTSPREHLGEHLARGPQRTHADILPDECRGPRGSFILPEP